MKCNKGSFRGEVCAFMGERGMFACNCVLTGAKCIIGIKPAARAFEVIFTEMLTLIGHDRKSTQEHLDALAIGIWSKQDAIRDFGFIVTQGYYTGDQLKQLMELLEELKEAAK